MNANPDLLQQNGTAEVWDETGSGEAGNARVHPVPRYEAREVAGLLA